MSKRYLLLAVQFAFYAVIVIYVVRKFGQLTASIDLENVLKNPLYIGLSIGCFLGFYFLLAWHWHLISNKISQKPLLQHWLAFFASQPYKYLPSSAFTFSARAVYSKKLGLPIKQSSFAQMIENADILGAGLCIGVIFWAFNMSFIYGFGASAIFILALGLITLIPPLRIPKSKLVISGYDWAKLFIIPFFAWFFAGTGFYSLVQATGQSVDFASAVAANTLAMCLGILVIIAPGGIGVREFVYDKFAISTTGIVMWRLLTLVADIVLGAIAIYLIGRRKDKD